MTYCAFLKRNNESHFDFHMGGGQNELEHNV